ncbi:MAG: hypothetical protein JWP69_474 [Flaviaesturariibacter sp.]|nr:hypothetical protein [Flaviaesturariibacter sp.]
MIAFFQKIIDVLDECETPYMLSGSIAMGIYIIPRATRDFDFIVHLQPEDVAQFVENFKDGFYCDKDAVADAVKRQSLFNIIDFESGYKADFVILSQNEFRKEEFSRKRKVDYFGKHVSVVTAEDLLLSKIIWIQELQSAVQQEDIKNLSALESLDWKYINEWIVTLKLNTFDLLPQ